MNSLPDGGVILVAAGTHLVRTTINMKSNIKLKGQGEMSVLKLDNTQNKDVVTSDQFTTLTGSGTSGSFSGPYNVYIEDLMIDGNKVNNTTGGWGIRYYGYDWHLRNIHILNCKAGGIWSEWADNPICPQTFVCMESFYQSLRIQACENYGWYNRGPHDSQASDVIIYTINGTGYYQEYLTGKYDGSCYFANCHIYDIQFPGSIAADIEGGTLTFVNLTTESTPNPGGIGVKTGNTGIIRGSQYWTYLNDTGIQLNTAGNLLSSICATDNRVKGVEILSNDNFIAGVVWNTTSGGSGTNILLGSAGASVAANMLSVKTAGSPTAMLNWANAGNQGNIVNLEIYTDSTNSVAVIGTPNLTTNTLIVEHLATGNSVKYIDGKPLVYSQGTKNPFYKKYGTYQSGATESLVGILSGAALTGTNTFASDPFQGITCSKDTGTTANSRAGLNGGSSAMVALTCRRLNPRIKVHVKTGTTTSARCYFGLSSATAIPASDAPLGSTDSGVIVGYRTTDSTWQIFNNDG